MNNFIRKILIKITGIGECGTPFIQMERENKIQKIMKGSTDDLSKEDKDLLIKYHDVVSK